LGEIGGDQNQALGRGAALELEEAFDGPGLQGIAAQAVDRLGGVGDDAAAAQRLCRPAQREGTHGRSCAAAAARARMGSGVLPTGGQAAAVAVETAARILLIIAIGADGKGRKIADAVEDFQLSRRMAVTRA